MYNQSSPWNRKEVSYSGFFSSSVKLLITMLSTWLQNTPGGANPSAYMLLGGISLKMGTYRPILFFLPSW